MNSYVKHTKVDGSIQTRASHNVSTHDLSDRRIQSLFGQQFAPERGFEPLTSALWFSAAAERVLADTPTMMPNVRLLSMIEEHLKKQREARQYSEEKGK